MPVGRMRTALDVEQNKPVRDPAGQMVEQWEIVREGVLFSIEPSGGGESPQGEQVEATVTHLLECRWFAGAAPGMRLRKGSRVFHVERVTNVQERDRVLQWQVREEPS